VLPEALARRDDAIDVDCIIGVPAARILA